MAASWLWVLALSGLALWIVGTRPDRRLRRLLLPRTAWTEMPGAATPPAAADRASLSTIDPSVTILNKPVNLDALVDAVQRLRVMEATA